jgi:N-carbamoylputrescine amidase
VGKRYRVNKMKVSLFQFSFYSRKQTKRLIYEKLSSLKTDLLVLPELTLHPYFCRKENIKNFQYSKYYDKDIKFFSKLSKKFKIVIVASLFEKQDEGIYYNTAIVFEKDGTIAGKYRKSHIPHDDNFYEKYYFTPSNDEIKPIKTSIGNLGVLICWDQWFPEMARIMALKGADILIYPTAIGSMKNDKKKETKSYIKAWKNIQKSHSIANQIPLISVNRVGIEGKKEAINFWGKSFICDALGKITKIANNKEKIITTKIDLSYSSKLKQIWPFFRDRRSDIYKDLLTRNHTS